MRRVQSQCYSEPILGKKVGNIRVERDDFEIKDFMSAIIQLLIIVKQETFENVGDFFKTGSGSNLCQFVGLEVNLQELTSLNSSITLPVLTSARVVENKILIQGAKQSTLVSYSLLATLLKIINLKTILTSKNLQL